MNADPSTARPPLRNCGGAKKDCGRFAQDDKSRIRFRGMLSGYFV